MAEVKWIKIVTDIFNNRKVRQIEKMPDADSILVIWLKILCLAGNINENGLMMLTHDIPYTDEMMANEFGKPVSTVRLALKVFTSFGMIEMFDNVYCVANWEKYQNVQGLDKIREQTRERVARHREMKKISASNVTCNVTVTDGNATDIDKELDIDKEKELDTLSGKAEPGIYKNIVDYLNLKAGTKYYSTTKKTRTLIKARLDEHFNEQDFYTVIDKKCKEWIGDSKMQKFLRPETLFGTKFEGYLNQTVTTKSDETINNLKEWLDDEE